jgi:hypothetical protein
MSVENMAEPAAASNPPSVNAANVDLDWVWREVRKRVFIKLPFSLGLADAMEAAVPITLDTDTFVCGLSGRDYVLAGHLNATPVRNTIENILRQAAHRAIRFEVIEGTTLQDWTIIKQRAEKAHDAVIAMVEQQYGSHQYDDILNQIVAEIRKRVTSTPDRLYPQVRVQLMLDMVPSLADAEEMLFPDPDAHDARRAMARTFDRVSGFLEIPPFTLALEIERYRRENQASRYKPRDKPDENATPTPAPQPE